MGLCVGLNVGGLLFVGFEVGTNVTVGFGVWACGALVGDTDGITYWSEVGSDEGATVGRASFGWSVGWSGVGETVGCSCVWSGEQWRRGECQ